LHNALAESHRTEQVLGAELQAARSLQHVATKSIASNRIEALYDQILDTALLIAQADMASIQMLHPEKGTHGELKLLGHRGFGPEDAKRAEWVGPNSRTTCGQALCRGRTVTVSDVRKCDFMVGSAELERFLQAGIQAAQSMPLVSRSGVL